MTIRLFGSVAGRSTGLEELKNVTSFSSTSIYYSYYTSYLFGHMVIFGPLVFYLFGPSVIISVIQFSIYLVLRIWPYGPDRPAFGC